MFTLKTHSNGVDYAAVTDIFGGSNKFIVRFKCAGQKRLVYVEQQ